MTLSARSIAVQGIGFGPRMAAMQGLIPVDELATIRPPDLGAGGGASLSLSEWRARFAGGAIVPTALPGIRKRRKRTKREREEELLILLH